MKMRFRFKENEIHFYPSRIMPSFIIIFGLLCFIPGILIEEYISSLREVFFSLAIVCISGALFLILRMYSIKFIINKKLSVISIINANISSVHTVTVPLEYFYEIAISCVDLMHINEKGIHNDVYCISNYGSALRLFLSKNHEAASEFAHELHVRIMNSQYQNDSFAIEDYIKGKIQPFDTFQFSGSTNLHKFNQGPISIIDWREPRPIIQLFMSLALVMSVYQFGLSMIRFWNGNNAVKSFFIYSLVATTVCVFFHYFYPFLVRRYIRLEPGGIEIWKGFLGKKWSVQSLSKNNIGLIINCIDPRSRWMTILGKNGKSELIDNDNSANIEDRLTINGMSELLPYSIFSISLSGLSINEKMYIEYEILKKMW